MFPGWLVSALAALLLWQFQAAVAGAGGGDYLLDRLASIESESRRICPAKPGSVDLHRTISNLAAEQISLADIARDGASRVEALNRIIFGDLGVRASQDLKDPRNLLPSRVLERKQGYCVGIAALYFALAEQLGLPIHAVATPSHVFLRYDDGVTRINIETFQRGASVSDEQYVRDQRIPEKSIRKGVFMRNLTEDEFLAQVHNNLGVIYSERKEYEKAAVEYGLAIDLDPHLPAAFYNRGNNLLARGQYRRAVSRFSRALHLYPTDVWALNNRGLAYLKLGRRSRARRDFEEALRIDPAFTRSRANLDRLENGPLPGSRNRIADQPR